MSATCRGVGISPTTAADAGRLLLYSVPSKHATPWHLSCHVKESPDPLGGAGLAPISGIKEM